MTRSTSRFIPTRKLAALLIAAAIVSSATDILGQDGDGGDAGAFLQIPAGARPTAMGGAYRSISDDGAAPLFNPAGLNNLNKPLLSTSYRAMQLDRKLGYLTVALPIQGRAVIGFQWLYAGSGSVMARDEDGMALDREISQNTSQISILFAKRFENYLAAGVNISYLHSGMTEISANSVGFDFGAVLYFDWFVDREKREDMAIKDIQLGLLIKNIAKTFTWNSEKYNLKYTTGGLGFEQKDAIPVEIGIGLSSRFLKRKLLLASDISKNAKQAIVPHFGAEYSLSPEFALRAGYGDERLTAGTGYVFHIGKKLLAIDYAFSTDRVDEGSEHIFSFDLLF
ncbi:MAG: PorV/PorQ family protein [candidate division Zixibacteria bacterium]|nr:PorV/PorQ family protein [candidate division Zixibacteria bacterium]